MIQDIRKTGNQILYPIFLVAALAAVVFAHQAHASTASAAKVMTLALTEEPPNLNAMKATDQSSFFVLGHTMEGLTRYDQAGHIVAGVAEKWEITETGATFWLRKNAKWSDGKTVTAKDFVFAWKTALDPATASEYAFILYPIKGAEAINTKKADPTTLGAQAVDDYTLKIAFEKPCGYFMGLTSFATYFPVREDVYKKWGEKFAADADKMLFNGPFVLTKWVHGASLRMDKNPTYWNAKAVDLETIDVPYITNDEMARFNFFKDKKIDVLGLNKENLQNAQKEKFKLKRFSDGSLFFLEYNFRDGHVVKNKNLRKAIQLVFNGEEYVNKVVGVPGTTPGISLIPRWLMGKKDNFRKEYPVSLVKPNVAEAKKYMEKARKELGISGPVSIAWLTGDSPLASKEAEYFQNLLKNTLGIELKIDKQIFKQRLAKMSAGDFDVVSAGWGPDYNDPMTFADLKTSWNENNRGKWENKEFDELIRKAQASADQKVRMDNMAAAEKILLEELPLMPLYERTIVYTHSERIDGIVRRAVGFDPDYTWVKVAGKK